MVGAVWRIMLEADNHGKESDSDDATDVLGTDVSQLQVGVNVDWFGIANRFLLMRVGGIGGDVPDPTCRVGRFDNFDSRFAIFVDWDWAVNLGAEKVLDRSSLHYQAGCNVVRLEFCISRARMLAAEGGILPVSSGASKGGDGASDCLVVVNRAPFAAIRKDRQVVGHGVFFDEADGDFTLED